MTRTRTHRRAPDLPKLAGGWVALGELGKGGNGMVYRAVKDGQEGAFKRLRAETSNQDKRRKRFVREIEAMQRCAGLTGVLPLLDAVAVRDGLPVEQPWLVSAVAKPLDKALNKEASLEVIVVAIHEIAVALATMHQINVSHRDIKPDNLFLFDGRWCVGDLGLAEYDEMETLTQQGERLGPTFYIASEMLNNAQGADGKKADVFSLAKTLWKLATGMNYPIPGAYFRGVEAFSIASYRAHARAHLLDPLIFMATDHDSDKRPTMHELAKGLDAWQQPQAWPAMTGPIPLNVDQYRNSIEAMRADGMARREQAEVREAVRKHINSRWVGPINGLVDRIYASLADAPFDNTPWNPADLLNCNGWVEAWVEIPQPQARVSLRLVFNFQAYEHPRCWFDMVVALDIQRSNLHDGPILFQKRWDVIEGTAEEVHVMREVNTIVNENLQMWVEAFFTRIAEFQANGE